jgi:hypothetical protein
MPKGQGRQGLARGPYGRREIKTKSLYSGEYKTTNVSTGSCGFCGKKEDRLALAEQQGYCSACVALVMEKKLRLCLSCEKMFKSVGKFNRRCRKCSGESAVISDTVHTYNRRSK